MCHGLGVSTVDFDRCGPGKFLVCRWLTVQPAAERLLEGWEAVKSYFQSEERPPKALLALLHINRMGTEEPGDPDIVKLYLTFFVGVSKLFGTAILAFEGDKCVTDVFVALSQLRDKLKGRLDNCFYGQEVSLQLLDFEDEKAHAIRGEFQRFYETALCYLEKWFDFESGGFLATASKFSLKHDFPGYYDFTSIAGICKGLSVDQDTLFDEIQVLSSRFSCMKEQLAPFSPDVRWGKVMRELTVPNAESVIRFIFSIPGSNAHAERVFSHMKLKFTDVRNRCSNKLIKSELQVATNYAVTCSEFPSLLERDEDMLKKVKGCQKYE